LFSNVAVERKRSVILLTGAKVTANVAVLCTLFKVALNVDIPVEIAVASPRLLIEATRGAEELQANEVVIFCVLLSL
jgi:hypothetical protein